MPRKWDAEFMDLLTVRNQRKPKFTSEQVNSLLRNVVGQKRVLYRSLHPALEKLRIERCGFHSFRRFPATFLGEFRLPELLIRFWLGHASKNVTDGYVRWENEPAYRLSVADEVGLGFELPQAESPIVRNVHKKIGPAGSRSGCVTDRVRKLWSGRGEWI